MLALDLAEASVKVRTGPPVDDDDDVAAGGRWAGVVPIRTVVDAPLPCTLLPPGTPTPRHVLARCTCESARPGPRVGTDRPRMRTFGVTPRRPRT